MSESCETCRFSAKALRVSVYASLACRRFPPTWEIHEFAKFPQVRPRGWCGEYQAKDHP